LLHMRSSVNSAIFICLVHVFRPNGVISSVQCIQSLSEHLKKDSIISVKYNGYDRNGRLINPVFWQECDGVDWNAVKTATSIKFSRHEKGYWTNPENQQTFLTELGKQLGFEKMEDWYDITRSTIKKHGGGNLLNRRFQSSPLMLLRKVYPKHLWFGWNMRRIPKGYWNNLDNQRNFLEYLSKKLHIREPEAWYRVSHFQVTFCDLNNH
jgi:hypothetical protein